MKELNCAVRSCVCVHVGCMRGVCLILSILGTSLAVCNGTSTDETVTECGVLCEHQPSPLNMSLSHDLFLHRQHLMSEVY